MPQGNDDADDDVAPRAQRQGHGHRRLPAAAGGAQGGRHQASGPARARRLRRRPLGGAEHQGRAVRRRQRAQGGPGRLRPPGDAARAGRREGRNGRDALPAARHAGLRAGRRRRRHRRGLPGRAERRPRRRLVLPEEGGLRRRPLRGRADPDGRPGRRQRPPDLRGREAGLREARLRGQAAAAVPADRADEVLRLPGLGRRGLPERRLGARLRRRPDLPGPDVQRREHPAGRQRQRLPARRPGGQRGDREGLGADRSGRARRRLGRGRPRDRRQQYDELNEEDETERSSARCSRHGRHHLRRRYLRLLYC